MTDRASTSAAHDVPDIHNCPICTRSDSISHLCDVASFRIYTCGYCKCDHTLPTPSVRDLKAYYDRREWFEGGEQGGYRNYDEQTEWSLSLYEKILREHGTTKSPSVLDVGCGYGTHLALAQSLGWKCFGVEVSEHARAVALERLSQDAQIVEHVRDLVPHRFDIVTIFDTIEHLSEPYQLFFNLFSLGAIDEATTVVFTTPNAECALARSQPAAWAYRHPPSHLTYYSGATFKHFLSVLRFKEVSIEGQSRIKVGEGLDCFDGLLVRASGSDFAAFMQERYVPGTWSKVAEYEHVPRYALASSFVENKRVIDFGCGTGYGAAMLARTATSVCGLDIDADAIAWAQSQHRFAPLKFTQSSDFGDDLPSASFDVATCFEMIEHVDYTCQMRTIDSIARLLTPNGLLIISTPNPDVTQLYGANPYHLREMSREEFRALLAPHFKSLQILDQFAHPGVFFRAEDDRFASYAAPMNNALNPARLPPLAFVALCRKSAASKTTGRFFYDGSSDFVGDFIEQQSLVNQLKFKNYAANERINDLENRAIQNANVGAAISDLQGASLTQSNEIHRLNSVVVQKDNAVAKQTTEIRRLEQILVDRDIGIRSQGVEIHRLNDVIVQKDAAVTRLTLDIRRTERTLVESEAGLHQHAAEIHRLNEVVVQKDAAVAQQTNEIRERQKVIVGHEAHLHVLTAEIHRLNDVIVQKDAAVALQTNEIRGLQKVIVGREASLQQLTSEIHRLNDVVAQQTNRIRGLQELILVHEAHLQQLTAEIHRTTEIVRQRDETVTGLHVQLDEKARRESELVDEASVLRTSVTDAQADTRASLSATRELRIGLQHWQQRFNTLNDSRWVSLGHALTTHPITVGSLRIAGTALLSLCTPTFIKQLLRRSNDGTASKRLAFARPDETRAPDAENDGVYQVKTPLSIASERPRVLHVIANFCTGGSSRLVVDLIERLGANYEQRIVTSFIPSPPAYAGINIYEIREHHNERAFTRHMVDYAPDFVHVHYWGDCDKPWYACAMSSANKLGLPVIQNINTPVAPYVDSSIVRNVYVSDYVREQFGHASASNLTIHPGSDFALFSGGHAATHGDCVGMVYRLERDKLDETAILPFIAIAKQRAQTRILIVGGGSLLEPFRQAVQAAGVERQFEFTGYVPYAQLPELYAQMTLFVAPVWKESFGQVSPFAMSMGVAVCGYDVGALAEITGTPSTLAPCGDHERLAEIMIDLLTVPEKRSAIAASQSARARSHFSVEAMVAAYEKLYNEVRETGRKS